MSGWIDRDPGPVLAQTVIPPSAAPLAAVAFDPDAEVGNRLPSDHPAWAKDAISLSQRARELLATLKPLALRVLTFWDHRIRRVVIGANVLSIDASGSYRLGS